jgi:hypothetical protein
MVLKDRSGYVHCRLVQIIRWPPPTKNSVHHCTMARTAHNKMAKYVRPYTVLRSGISWDGAETQIRVCALSSCADDSMAARNKEFSAALHHGTSALHEQFYRWGNAGPGDKASPAHAGTTVS